MHKFRIYIVTSLLFLVSANTSTALELLSQYDDIIGQKHYQFIVDDKVFTPSFVEEAVRGALVDPITEDTKIVIYEYGQYPERLVSSATDIAGAFRILSLVPKPNWRWLVSVEETGEFNITDCKNPISNIDFHACGLK